MAEIKYSSEGYDSTQAPFFAQDNENASPVKIINCLTEVKIRTFFDTHIIEKNADFTIDEKLIKFFVDKPYGSETYLGEWTIMSFKNILERYEIAKKEGICVIDLGFSYLGMGHILVAFYDPKMQKYYFRRDGGSSGWDRQYNFKLLCNYKSDADDKLSFSFDELMQQIHCEIKEKAPIF